MNFEEFIRVELGINVWSSVPFTPEQKREIKEFEKCWQASAAFTRKQVVEECAGVANSMIGEWDGLVPSECFEHWNQACKEIAAELVRELERRGG